VRVGATNYYSSSLLGNLCATTKVRDEMDSHKPGYLTHAPEISLGEEEGNVVLTTATGCFRHALLTRNKDRDKGGRSISARDC
jgi:hypothetical protein